MSLSRDVAVLRDSPHDKIMSFGDHGIFRKPYLDAMINGLIRNREIATTDVQLVNSAWDVMLLQMWLGGCETT